MTSIKITGSFLKETLESLKLEGTEKARTIENAKNIVSKIISTNKSSKKPGSISKPIGLVYGRIQSGKTRAMIASTALAFDNDFRIAVVLTSNINDLVNQTHLDFTTDLKGVTVFTKDDELKLQAEDAKLDLEDPEGRILVIASKGPQSLKNITEFLKNINATGYPVVIFDDEGDQASLDTNTYRRSKKGIKLEPSPINKLILKLRNELSQAVYISVTGTPQAILLQAASSDNRPSFVEMLPAGDGYIGGDHFFSSNLPSKNEYNLISIVSEGDKANLLNTKKKIPDGLRQSIIFFLLSAAAAKHNKIVSEKGFQFLCHPSLKNTEQSQAVNRILRFLTDVKAALMGKPEFKHILEDIDLQYLILQSQLGDTKTPPLVDLKKIIRQELQRKRVLTINSANAKRRGIEYGPGFNFLVGGNTLGRGIAIPNLLVTYYVRDAKMSQIDTMYQHARMFGYRSGTLNYTRLFITRNLYFRFRDIHYSDKGLREFIVKNENQFPNAFPVEIAAGLRPTRRGVLDVNSIEAIWPGMQIYPDRFKIPPNAKWYRSIIEKVASHLECEVDLGKMTEYGKKGRIIKTSEAISIVSQINTNAGNVWNDKSITAVLEKLGQNYKNKIRLKFRTADRTIGTDGFLPSGALGGKEQGEARDFVYPTLWIMSLTGKSGSKSGEGERFIFPTIVVPNGLSRTFLFSKK